MVYTGPVGPYEPAPATVRCWQCGVESTGTVEVTTLGEREPRYLPTGWPPGDHEHAVDQPTPGQLEQAGHEALSRIQREAWT